MLRMLLLLCLPALLASCARAQHAADTTRAAATADSTMDDAYRIFTSDGHPATLDDLTTALGAAEVVFVGEQHDDPVAHHLQVELLQWAYQHVARGPARRPLTLSLEMFERDVQLLLDEYLAGQITESHFLRASRPPKNYKTDYKPLVEFAKAHGLPVLAANAPRRYVNRVSRLGPASLDSLSARAQRWLPPLPYPGPSPEYVARWNAMMAEMMASHAAADSSAADSSAADSSAADSSAADTSATHGAATHAAAEAEEPAEVEEAEEDEAPSPPSHGNGYMLDAQALWDAGMAHTLSRHLAETPGALVLHVVGSFHVESGLGLPAQLDGYRPGTRRLIVFIKAADAFTTFDAEEYAGLGDFIILTDKSLPRSMEPSFQ